MVRIAALGDSITYGMGDPAPGGGWRGWASLLASATAQPSAVPASVVPASAARSSAAQACAAQAPAAQASLAQDPASVAQASAAQVPAARASATPLAVVAAGFRNFAAPGALTGDVAGEQLEQALAWRPQVATVLVGVNDCLRGTFSINTIGPRLHHVVDALCAGGTRVVLACLPEPGRMLGLPQALARPLARRVQAINEIIHALTRGYPVTHVHLTSDSVLADRRMWSIDRLHPSERGHRWLAALAYDALQRDGWPVGERPGLEPLNPPPTRRAQAWWMATKGTRWLYARSTDLVPQLMGLAAHEWRLMRRGLASQLDVQMADEVRAVVHALTPHGQEIPPSFTIWPAGS